MEVNNNVATGYMPRRRSGGRTKEAGEEDFLAKMSQALGQEEEEKDVPEENPLQTTEDMMRFIRERKQEICDKVRKGETEVKIRIGACEYTEKEWDKLMESFDEAEDEIREQIREAREQQRKACEKLALREKDAADAAEQEAVIEKLLADREQKKEVFYA